MGPLKCTYLSTLAFLTVSNFSLHLIISLGLLLKLPKDLAGVGDVKETLKRLK